MTETDLSNTYRQYIVCLNQKDWPKLGLFVHEDVIHNGRRIGLSGYRDMLQRDYDEIPDLHFNVEMLIAKSPYVSSRIAFDCTPKGNFFGLDINGRKVSFAEHAIYEFAGVRIAQVWSIIDKAAIEAQL